MNNKEIADLIFANLKDVYEVRCVDIEETYRFGKEVRKEISIWVNDENCGALHRLLSSFTLPVNFDEKTLQRFVTASINLSDLDDAYGN
jgi:hypothetical protein